MKSFTAQTDVPAKTIVLLHCMKFDNNNKKNEFRKHAHIIFICKSYNSSCGQLLDCKYDYLL